MNPTSLSPGAFFSSDFRIVRTLGEGGMGAVYVAEQMSTGKLRALKTMHPQFVADAGLRERFAQEARIGARIDSEHVVDVVAAGVDAATRMPWLAMELLKGETVADAVASGHEADPRRAQATLLQLGDAIAVAHVAGVVHRDLKPENLFLASTKRGDVPFVLKVLDFGIAKLVSEGASSITATVGTPLWMAPEQTELGSAITPAADVWAYGLIAFYVLTGQSYWHVRIDGHEVSGAALLRQIVLDALPSASERAAQLGVTTPLPAGFDSWFARCVARRPEARFSDGAAALATLAAMFGVSLGLSSTMAAEVVAAAAHPAPRTGSRGGTIPLFTPPPVRGEGTVAGVAGATLPPRIPVRRMPIAALLAIGALIAAVGAYAAFGARPAPGSTAAPHAPAAVVAAKASPLEPRDGKLFSSTPIELKWTSVDATSQPHDIEVARADDAGEPSHSPAGMAYAMWPWAGATATAGAYRWRVREAEGTWSSWATFAVYPSLLDRVKERKTLRVGMETTYHEPFTYYDSSKKQVVGFDVELAEEIARGLGVRLERSSREWKDCFTAMETRELDVVISAVSVTKERSRKYGFSDPYLRTGVVLTTRTGSERVVAPGSGKTVGAQRQTTASAAGHRMFPQAALREYDTLDGAIAALGRSEVDALLSDETVVRRHAAVRAGGYRVDGKLLTDDAYAVMMPLADEPLRARINAVLKELTASGRIAELKKAYGLR